MRLSSESGKRWGKRVVGTGLAVVGFWLGARAIENNFPVQAQEGDSRAEEPAGDTTIFLPMIESPGLIRIELPETADAGSCPEMTVSFNHQVVDEVDGEPNTASVLLDLRVFDRASLNLGTNPDDVELLRIDHVDEREIDPDGGVAEYLMLDGVPDEFGGEICLRGDAGNYDEEAVVAYLRTGRMGVVEVGTADVEVQASEMESLLWMPFLER